MEIIKLNSDVLNCGHYQQEYKKDPYSSGDFIDSVYAYCVDSYAFIFNICRKCAFKRLFGGDD